MLKFLTSEEAILDLEWETCFYWNKNCLDRFETSISSSSTTTKLPLGLQDNPLIANNFKNSHPKAPAPTNNTLDYK